MNDVSTIILINSFADEAQPWVRPSAILDALDGHRGRVTFYFKHDNDPSSNTRKLLLK